MVSIIAILVAVLLPALGAARQMALRAKCMSHLRQWGTGVATYAADNDNEILETTWRSANPDRRQPIAMTIEPDVGHNGQLPPGTANFSVKPMNPYIGKPFDIPNKTAERNSLVFCPNTAADWPIQQRVTKFWKKFGFIAHSYAYYGRVDKMEDHLVNGAGEVLTRRRLHPERVLMTDMNVVASAKTPSRHAYNHGENGAWTDIWDFVRKDNPPESDLGGMHRLMGDGSVHWKGRSQFPMSTIFNPSSYPGPMFTFQPNSFGREHHF